MIKTNLEKTKEVIGNLACFIKDISILLWPFIPATTEKVFDLLNLDKSMIKFENLGNYKSLFNNKIKEPGILFKKLEKDFIESLKEKFGKKKIDPKELFSKLHLKVGIIIEIKRHPKADKLYVEKVDLGSGEIRQIVSGLVPYYKEEELLNKKIVLAYNLKEANLRGEISQGMLLAAENKNKETVEVISPDVEVGTEVIIEGSTPNKNEITIDEFFSVPMEVKDFTVTFMDQKLISGGKELKVGKVQNGKVG